MYPIEYIYKALSYYFNEKLSFNKIGKKLNISRQIVSIWINNFNKDILFLTNRNNIKNIKINIKINNFDVNLFIKQLIYKNPFITRQELLELVYLQFKIKLSLNHISKIFKILNLTRKKPKFHIVRSLKFIDELIIKRKLFLENINKEQLDKIISIDESGFNKLLNFNKGLSEKGKQINIPIKQKQNKNISLLLAVTTKGILNYHIKKENINSLLFFEFIKEIIDKLTDKNYIFIFDNVSFHHNKHTLKLIINSGHKYIFVPPYSPNNNPVENVFSIVKNKYNKIKYKVENKENITDYILKILKQINTQFSNFNNLFKRSLIFSYCNIEKELRDRIIFIT